MPHFATATSDAASPTPREISALSSPRCALYTSRGKHASFAHIEAAIPTISPMHPHVRITRTAPSASCDTLMSRPARNKFDTLRLYRHRYGAQYGPLYM